MTHYYPVCVLLDEFMEPEPLRKSKSARKEKQVLNLEAVLALQTLGTDKLEAKRQVQIAMELKPHATTEELILACIAPKGRK